MFSPQTQQLYQILLHTGKPIEAKMLAKQIQIVPSSLYRLVQPLEEMGLVSKSDSRPYTFSAKPTDESLSLYLLHQNDWFMQQFLPSNKSNAYKKDALPESREMSLSFIQSRDELMHMAADEIAKTTKSVNLLRSGHEMIADVMLAIKEALNRDVVIRMLIQDYSEEKADQVKNWQANGILVKKTPLQHVRLMLFDAKVLYFMSYKNTDSAKDLGMKIDYQPFATIQTKLFNDWWKNAEII